MQDINATFHEQGYAVAPNVYTGAEVAALIAAIEAAPAIGANYRGGGQPFAIRSFLQEVPAVLPLLANAALRQLLQQVGGAGYSAVRAIYFNKPPIANWLVPWHQDLTISVKERATVQDYSGWTSKNGYMSVCPPAQVLDRIVTLRIHLDDATAANGALQVLPGSHLWGITPPLPVVLANKIVRRMSLTTSERQQISRFATNAPSLPSALNYGKQGSVRRHFLMHFTAYNPHPVGICSYIIYTTESIILPV